ncbi:MAG: TetR/AcrR family transcriptional regulator [Phycisphaerae bacterium]|nr:TetR/AcrR family transcriptional regulator [Gemmatimonadaceae bacterium]
MAYPSKTDRNTILAAAMDQVSEKGIGALAIRSVAAALDLAPNALYRYFANLAALEEALAEESRRLLLDVLQQAAGQRPPQEAIRSIAQAYVKFARERPQIFALTLMAASTDLEGEAAHEQSWQFVLGQVSRVYPLANAPEAAVALWAFLYGITALEAAGVFGELKPTSSFDFGLQMWIGAASRY